MDFTRLEIDILSGRNPKYTIRGMKEEVEEEMITPEEMYYLIPEKCQKCEFNAIQRLMYCEDCEKEDE